MAPSSSCALSKSEDLIILSDSKVLINLSPLHLGGASGRLPLPASSFTNSEPG